MSTASQMIDSKFRCLLAVCILPLCLAISAPCATVPPANPTVRMSSIIDLPEIPFPPPPPSLGEGSAAMEQTA